MTAIPDYDQLPTRDGVPCSWGLWGRDDVLGCLNLLTPDRVAAAARLVTRGARFSLNWSMALPDPPLFDRPTFRHDVLPSAASPSLNDILHDWNTQSSSQWDGFRHVSRHGHGWYNGIPDAEHGVHHWARAGIAGRAVLADVARWRAAEHRPWPADSSEPIGPDDLRATLEAQGSPVEPGDILLIRTGWTEWYSTLNAEQRAAIAPRDRLRAPGLLPAEATARLLWNLHVAAVATDNPAVEVTPPGALMSEQEAAAIRADPARRHEMFLHVRLLPMLGMPMGELWDLSALAADCATDGRYTFLLTSAPLNLPGGAASPANAMALK